MIYDDKMILYFDMGEALINLFDEVISFRDKYDFDVSVNGMAGCIFNGEMSISCVFSSDNEFIYIYHDKDGMICINTSDLDMAFTKVYDKNYFGAGQFEKEPLEFIKKVTNKLKSISYGARQYHI